LGLNIRISTPEGKGILLLAELVELGFIATSELGETTGDAELGEEPSTTIPEEMETEPC